MSHYDVRFLVISMRSFFVDAEGVWKFNFSIFTGKLKQRLSASFVQTIYLNTYVS